MVDILFWQHAAFILIVVWLWILQNSLNLWLLCLDMKEWLTLGIGLFDGVMVSDITSSAIDREFDPVGSNQRLWKWHLLLLYWTRIFERNCCLLRNKHFWKTILCVDIYISKVRIGKYVINEQMYMYFAAYIHLFPEIDLSTINIR
jgi:predicted transglutaminase-like protease